MAEWCPSCPADWQQPRLVVDTVDGAGPAKPVAERNAGAGEFRECRDDGYVGLCPGIGSRVVVDSTTGSLSASSVELIDIGLIHALALEGVLALHASVFDVYGARVVAVADSGAGKSTLAAAAIRCGGKVVSDDAVVAAVMPEGVMVASFRRDLVLRPGSLELLPESVREDVGEAMFVDGPRRILERDVCPAVFTPMIRPDRLWMLELDTSRFRGTVTPISQSEAAVALIRGATPLHLSPRFPTERSRVLPVLTSLIEQVEASHVVLGTDLITEPEASLQRLLG